MTSLPASMMILVCLFLPHTQACHGAPRTPFESGTWIVVAPIALLGLMPVLWRVVPAIRRGTPELVLAFTMIVMALVVVTIPFAIWLMWGYGKKQFRGEVLVGMCGVALVSMWLFLYPLLTMFTTWQPAAEMTWGAAIVELVGLIVWTSAASERPENAGDAEPLHAPLGFEMHL